MKNEENNLINHAERELKLAGIHKKDADYNGMLYNAVMELVKVFSNQGHSGGSASRVISLFRQVAMYKNLTPLTGKDDEWNDVSDMGGGLLQNNRVSSVFKEKETGKSYYLDAIIWRTQKGSTWTGTTKEGIMSRQYIKKFPFMPKTFYVDVIEKEISKGNWEFEIKDKGQLEEVFEYYKNN